MKTRTASDIQESPIEWLWPRRIPLGRITIIEGDADIGKSRLTMELAALVSRGDKWPDCSDSSPLGTVLVANNEDIDESITVPRLKASGADMDNVEIFNLDDPDEKLPLIPDDIPAMASFIARLNSRAGKPPVRLIIIDPLDDFWAEKVNATNSQSVRRALRSLNKLAKVFGLAIVILRHLTKGSDGNAKHRGQGSVSTGALARSCILVAADQAQPGRSIIAPVKGNWSEKPPSWSFTQENYEYVTPNGTIIRTSKFIWGGAVRETANDLSRLDPNAPSSGEMKDAQAFLLAELASGPVLSAELEKRAGSRLKEALWRQKYAMDIVAKSNGKGWTWELKEQPNENSNCSDLDFTNA